MPIETVYPGIWKISLGQPEAFTPVTQRQVAPAVESLQQLPSVEACPLTEQDIAGKRTRRGYQVRLKLEPDEQVYGLGLQLLSFNQRRTKKTLRMNCDPRANLGDSHAPVPFFVTTRGYGVLVDTARYASFYFGALMPLRSQDEAASPVDWPSPDSLQSLIEWVNQDRGGPTLVDIPTAAGVDLYIFGGPTLRQAVQRYNLFSGGGCLPTRWGLGVWYRSNASFDQDQVVQMARRLRDDEMPCDVIGLEPGWQSRRYPCSFVWSDKFSQPAQLLQQLDALNYKANAWTHVFTHPASPLYNTIYPYAADYEVWGGLAPDLSLPAARQTMAEYFAKNHVDLGIAGYKLDECDNSDFNDTYWSFPEASEFPSGVDGEQMHSLYGLLCQETILSIYRQRNQRTYSAVRSSHALAAAYPFVLYSDLYNHQDFIRGVVNCGFSGLLWTPEVRDAHSEEDLIRRLQTVVLSPQALINAWYIQNPPWKQWRPDENNAGIFVENQPELEAACRQILELRMQLIPYLYAAFYRYWQSGEPPVRALVMDYPADAQVWRVDDQYLLGDRLMVAPVVAGQSERAVYLPEGQWYDFWSGQAYAGGQSLTFTVPLDRILIFVKGGALLPLAQPTTHTQDPASFNLTVRVYGDGRLPCELYEDDGVTFDYQQGAFNRLTLAWEAASNRGSARREGSLDCHRYEVKAWQAMTKNL